MPTCPKGGSWATPIDRLRPVTPATGCHAGFSRDPRDDKGVTRRSVTREGAKQCWYHWPRSTFWIVTVWDEKITGAMGPFQATELSSEVRPFIGLDTLDIAWIEKERRNFVVCTTDPELCRDGCRPRFGAA